MSTTKRFGKLAATAAFSLAAAFALYTLFAPVFATDENALPFLRAARASLFEGLIPAIILPFVLSAVLAIPAALMAVKLRANEGFGGAWAVLNARLMYVLLPLSIIVLTSTSFMSASKAPITSAQSFAAIDGITIDGDFASRFDSDVVLDETSRLYEDISGAYISTPGAVWSLASLTGQSRAHSTLLRPADSVFSRRDEPVSDFKYRRGHIFVIAAQTLYDVHDGKTTMLARLPTRNMRFGTIIRDFGSASAFLIYGSEGASSHVYELRPNGEYTKLVETDGKLVGADTCHDQTFVAYQERIVRVRPGFEPAQVFVAPQGDAITSTQIRCGSKYDLEQCVLLVSTKDAVFAWQNGISTLLISGLGGTLGANEDDTLGFTLVDVARNAAVKVSFKADEKK